jgi:hypothetical protein
MHHETHRIRAVWAQRTFRYGLFLVFSLLIIPRLDAQDIFVNVHAGRDFDALRHRGWQAGFSVYTDEVWQWRFLAGRQQFTCDKTFINREWQSVGLGMQLFYRWTDPEKDWGLHTGIGFVHYDDADWGTLSRFRFLSRWEFHVPIQLRYYNLGGTPIGLFAGIAPTYYIRPSVSPSARDRVTSSFRVIAIQAGVSVRLYGT